METNISDLAQSAEKGIAVSLGAVFGGVTWHNTLANVNLAHITLDQAITTVILTAIGMTVSATGTFFFHKLLTFLWDFNWSSLFRRNKRPPRL